MPQRQVVVQFDRDGCVREEIPRPAGENAGLRDDAKDQIVIFFKL